jgi:hypothetical protein
MRSTSPSPGTGEGRDGGLRSGIAPIPAFPRIPGEGADRDTFSMSR